jgi:nitrogen fixation NifU-like protein
VGLTREQLIERLAEHHRHPQHHGPLEGADVSAVAGNPGCGDVVTVHLRIEPGTDRIASASFEGTGCTISQGAASILMQDINRTHPTLADLRARSFDEHLDTLGREVVGFRERCAAVGFDAVRRAAALLDTVRRLEAAGDTPAEARRKVGLEPRSPTPGARTP